MAKVLNSEEVKSNLKLATDRECEDRRRMLVAGGIIKPAEKSEIVFRKNAIPVVSTRRARNAERRRLIEDGIIDPSYCELLPEQRRISSSEEGEYKPRPIRSPEEFERRKRAYFRVMQEILRSRKELSLILGPKKDDDPEWFF
jgi:hypothetical protein